MQGKHMVLQLDKKPPASYGADGDDDGRPDMAVVLRVEALDQEGLLHRLVDRIRALCRGQVGHDAPAGAGGRGGGGGTEDGGGGGGEGAGAGAGGGGGGGGARLEQYGLRGHTGSAIMEFLIAGAKVRGTRFYQAAAGIVSYVLLCIENKYTYKEWEATSAWLPVCCLYCCVLEK